MMKRRSAALQGVLKDSQATRERTFSMLSPFDSLPSRPRSVRHASTFVSNVTQSSECLLLSPLTPPLP